MRHLKTALALLAFAMAMVACNLGRPTATSIDLAGQNLVLITIDTLRADRLGAYGDRAAATPVIDGLARAGVRFANCYSSVTLTLPSHATLFTGRYPFAHGVRVNGIHYLPDAEHTLAESFQIRGYETFAAISSAVVNRKFGLAQGFDTYDDSLGSGDLFTAFEGQITADRVVDKFERWLGSRDAGPFFAWIHFYDPHLPYEPPLEERRKVNDDPYRGEIAFVDTQIGRIRAQLAKQGLNEETTLIITSDHGEAFGEHVEEGTV
jgi:arylsulfatase A-like enzyme